MIITNKRGLPAPFVKMAESDYTPTPKRYSATTLIKPVREIILTRRHGDEIERDCSDMIWALFGQSVHYILQQSAEGACEYAERRLEVQLENGYTVSGVIDLYDKEKREVDDYKVTSVYKYMKGDFEDWHLQGMIYAWLLWKNGEKCDKVKFVAILRDWSQTKAKTEAVYPRSQVGEYSFCVDEQRLKAIDEFIHAKIGNLMVCEQLSDEELPECTAEERWNDGDRYAVMRIGSKRALRVFDSMEAAEIWKQINGGDYIEKRAGEDRKCSAYCSCCTFCNKWNGKKKEDKNV